MYPCKTCMNSSSDGDRSRCDVWSNHSSTCSFQIQCHIANLSSMPLIRNEKSGYYQNVGTIINEYYIELLANFVKIFYLRISILLGDPRNNQVLILNCFHLVNIMTVHPLIHCGVKLVQKLNNL